MFDFIDIIIKGCLSHGAAPAMFGHRIDGCHRALPLLAPYR